MVDENIIKHLYLKEKLSTNQIAKKLNCSRTPVSSCLAKVGLLRSSRIARNIRLQQGRACRRDRIEWLQRLPELKRLYLEEKMATPEIARIYAVSDHAIRYWLAKGKIKLRSPAEVMQLRYENPHERQKTAEATKACWERGRSHIPYQRPSRQVKNRREPFRSHPCLVCSKPTTYPVFCSTLCRQSPLGKQYLSNKAKLAIARVPDEVFWRCRQLAKRRPNRAETRLYELLEGTFPGIWQYVGDGKLMIGRRCPDFTNVNGHKQLIELWGEYWHRGDSAQELISYYAGYGYPALVIWANELKHPETLKQRLLQELK